MDKNWSCSVSTGLGFKNIIPLKFKFIIMSNSFNPYDPNVQVTNTQTQPLYTEITTYSTVQNNSQVINQVNAPTPVTKNKADVDYYDQYDIEDINTGENYSYDETPSRWGMIGAILALLACLVIVGLMGVIYHRDKNSLTMSHLIMACIGVGAAGLAAGVCVMTSGALRQRRDPNHLLIAIALLGALIFFCYFLASTVYMFMYRPFHYGNLIQTNNKPNNWKYIFNDRNFESGWGEDRRILWWIAFFGIVAIVGFLISAICLWLMSWQSFDSGKLALGAACFAGVLLGCFAICYLWMSKNYQGNYAVYNEDVNTYLKWLLVMVIIGIILLTLNGILNVFKKRNGHFIFAVLLMFWAFITVCFLGLLWRNMRIKQFKSIDKQFECGSFMDSLHQDDIKVACPNKYLPGTCSKSFMRVKWETDRSVGFVDPSCCQSTLNYLLWPIYIAGALILLMIAAAIIAIAYNIYLSDKNEYLEFQKKVSMIPGLIFAVLILLCLIGFAFYWGFKDPYFVPKSNPANPDVIYSKYTRSVEGFKDDDFPVVDLNKVYKGNVPYQVYLENDPFQASQQGFNQVNGEFSGMTTAAKMHTGNAILTLKDNPQVCNDATCGFRIGILAQNANMDPPTDDTIVGSQAARN